VSQLKEGLEVTGLLLLPVLILSLCVAVPVAIVTGVVNLIGGIQ